MTVLQNIALGEKNRRKLAKKWEKLAQHVDYAIISKDFTDASKAIESYDVDFVYKALEKTLGAFYHAHYKRNATTIAWQLAHWENQLGQNSETRSHLYETAARITSVENAPTNLKESARQHFLDASPKMLTLDTFEKYDNIDALCRVYTLDNYPEDRPQIEVFLLAVLNDLIEEQKRGDINDYLLSIIIDAAMIKPGTSPFLKRAQEIRKNEIAEIVKDPTRRHSLGHANNILESLNITY